MPTPTQMPESLKVPEELAAIQQALDAGPTPGNWSSLTNRGGTSFLILDSEKRLVCSMSWHSSSREHYPLRAESAANSAVIAACNPAAMTAVLAHISALQSALKDRDAEIERLKKDAERPSNTVLVPADKLRELQKDAGRLEFMCSKAPLRFIEGNDDMWRVYQDEAPPEACAHKWRAIVAMYYPTAREAIDAAIDSMKGDANG